MTTKQQLLYTVSSATETIDGLLVTAQKVTKDANGKVIAVNEGKVSFPQEESIMLSVSFNYGAQNTMQSAPVIKNNYFNFNTDNYENASQSLSVIQIFITNLNKTQ